MIPRVTKTIPERTRGQEMLTEKQVILSLKEVIDPHTNISVYEMGLISEVKMTKNSVSVIFRPTSPFCPLGTQLAQSIKHRLESLKGVEKANVKVVGHIYEDRINGILKK
jgi:metal-sulfur cluster biosynthetic enzyme